MIRCDHCKDWFHEQCIEEYVCEECTKKSEGKSCETIIKLKEKIEKANAEKENLKTRIGKLKDEWNENEKKKE